MTQKSSHDTWPAFNGGGFRSLGCHRPDFFLSGTPGGQGGSGCPPRGLERNRNDLIPSHQYLDMSWATFKRNLPQYTRKGSWEAPQHGQFSLFCLVKSSKQRCNRTVGTHHSHELEIGLKMLVYYLPFIPKNFSLKHDTCQFSIKTREIPHYIPGYQEHWNKIALNHSYDHHHISQHKIKDLLVQQCWCIYLYIVHKKIFLGLLFRPLSIMVNKFIMKTYLHNLGLVITS